MAEFSAVATGSSKKRAASRTVGLPAGDWAYNGTAWTSKCFFASNIYQGISLSE